MEYYNHTLSNGLKIIIKPDKMPVTYCGIVINTGSRDESEQEWGMAHFIEHMLFKGTAKKTATQIINRLEDVGGELNAFTSKEETRRLQCGIFLKKKYDRFKYISTQNKVNFIKCDSPCVTYGLYVLLNSTLYDCYYRILNGSTQVNSTEINQMPIPERNIIEEMGRELMHHELSVANCNKILSKWIN